MERTRIAKTKWIKKNKIRGISLPNFNIYCIARVINTKK